MQNSTDTLQRLAFNEDYQMGLERKISMHAKELAPMYSLGFHGLDALVKSPESLTYEQCFSLGAYVCLTSNAALYEALAPTTTGYSYGLLDQDTLRLQSVSLLQSMSTREGIIGLQPQEIAGLVAATLELDTVVRVKTSGEMPTFAIGGMGGDKGLKMNGDPSKLFSISTLAALALSDFGPVHKHHSYPNTSKVAGQSAIEEMGARSDFSEVADMEKALDISGVLMTSCHSTRTLHSISHALKGETINHVIGPIAIPHSKTNEVNAMIGVNHNVHPSTLIDSLAVLQSKDIQKYGNSVAFCGIASPIDSIPIDVIDPKKYYKSQVLKNLVALDEVPPPPHITMASFLVNGENKGTYLISPTDFMEVDEAEVLAHGKILLPNEPEEILKANADVIRGNDFVKGRYVAMTVALALFARDYAHKLDALDQISKRVNSDYLKECYGLACEGISNGNLEKRTRLYVESTQKDMVPGIDLVIVDIDNTLVKPKDHDFYRQYGNAVNTAVSSYLGISIEEGTRVADFYRQNFGGGEMALFSGNISRFFPEYGEHEPNIELLYDTICSIDPSNQFQDDGISANLINLLRSQGKRVVAITDSPEELSRKILAYAGIKPDDDFDLYLPYTRERGPLKILQRETVFRAVADYFEIAPDRILSIGDTYKSDIEPAEKLGMRTCLVSLEESENDYVGLKAKKFDDVFELYRRSV